MKIQISRFSIHQTSKTLAILYFVLIALFTIPAGLIYAFYFSDMINAAIMFVMPFFGLIGYYIITAILLGFYNLVAKAFGGIEFQSTDNTK